MTTGLLIIYARFPALLPLIRHAMLHAYARYARYRRVTTSSVAATPRLRYDTDDAVCAACAYA